MDTTRQNPFAEKFTITKLIEKVIFGIFGSATYIVIAAAACIFLTIAIKGGREVFSTQFPFVNVAFLTEKPETLHVLKLNSGEEKKLGDRAYREFLQTHGESDVAEHETFAYASGGIFPAIVGTCLLVIGSMTIALVLGIISAIYLSEYSKQNKLIEIIRLSIMNLAGVPSIVFGMFGAAFFVLMLHFNISLIAGWFTLAFMVLPIIITASEESLRAVPKGFREGSLALGATKWQTVYQNVLPYALPGILTSSILSIARVAGETAPIMFTAAYAMRDKLPWEVSKFSELFLNGVMALPYHIYVVSSKVPQNQYTSRIQFATAFVFLVIVMLIALASILLRIAVRKKYRW